MQTEKKLIFKLHITAKKVLMYKPSNTPYKFQRFGLHLIRFQWQHLSTRHLQGIPSRPIVHSCPPDNCSQKQKENFYTQAKKSLQHLINGHLIILLHFIDRIFPLTNLLQNKVSYLSTCLDSWQYWGVCVSSWPLSQWWSAPSWVGCPDPLLLWRPPYGSLLLVDPLPLTRSRRHCD